MCWQFKEHRQPLSLLSLTLAQNATRLLAQRWLRKGPEQMNTFAYEGMTFSGQTVAGELHANSETELEDLLRADGILLVGARKVSVSRPWWAALSRNRYDASVTRYFRHLSTLVGAGIPLSRALDGLAERAQGNTWKELVTSVADRVRLGASFADALTHHEQVFSGIAIPMIAD